MKNLRLLLCLAGILIFGSAYSQCRTFVKNNCGDALGDYIPGENFNAAKLSPGDVAELKMTFYEGQDYRLLIANHPVLDSVKYQVLDRNGNILFNNTESKHPGHFDFRLEGTQELTVNLQVPEDPEARLKPQGCVAILVGRKVEK